MKLKRSTVLPVILGIYLIVMATLGYPDYASGKTSAAFYFGAIAVTVVVLILLHFNLKKREEYRQRRAGEQSQHTNV